MKNNDDLEKNNSKIKQNTYHKKTEGIVSKDKNILKILMRIIK